MRRLDARDLAHVLDHSRDVWDDLCGARVFLTGATGFVGSWMLETLVHADASLRLGIRATALVRDRGVFAARFPHLASSPVVQTHLGDVRTGDLPAHAFTHYVHCASAAPPEVNVARPDEVVDLIERGTARVLEQAESEGGARFLQVSSGSVYGPQPPAVERLDESYAGTADARDSAQRFGVAKLHAERRGEVAVSRGVGFVAARIFALVGPRMPLPGPFALGDFFSDALAGRPVRITGDGTPVRSWLHAADLAAWCWTLLARGRAGAAYNVGSEEALSLHDAARRVAALPRPPVTVRRAREPEPGSVPSRYVPSTRRAREELGLEAWIRFDDALRRTWDWLQDGDG